MGDFQMRGPDQLLVVKDQIDVDPPGFPTSEPLAAEFGLDFFDPLTGGVLRIELRRISEAPKVSSRSREAALMVSSVLPRFAPKLISELGIRKSAGY